MTTKVKVKQLEKKYDRVTNRGKSHVEAIRYITYNDRLIDKDGYLLNEDEVKRIKKEDEEVSNRGGMIIYLTSYSEPKIKTA